MNLLLYTLSVASAAAAMELPKLPVQFSASIEANIVRDQQHQMSLLVNMELQTVFKIHSITNMLVEGLFKIYTSALWPLCRSTRTTRRTCTSGTILWQTAAERIFTPRAQTAAAVRFTTLVATFIIIRTPPGAGGVT